MLIPVRHRAGCSGGLPGFACAERSQAPAVTDAETPAGGQRYNGETVVCAQFVVRV